MSVWTTFGLLNALLLSVGWFYAAADRQSYVQATLAAEVFILALAVLMREVVRR